MKVVLFCGGMGMRMRPLADGSMPGDDLPKPLVNVGFQRPLIWHVMKYYAHFGHKDFILCLGYKGEAIKRFFLNYNEFLNNDFVIDADGPRLLSNDIQDWRISFVDTGLYCNVGERLMAVREQLAGEPYFYANYSDGLCDIPLDSYTDAFLALDKTAGFVSVVPPQTCHVVHTNDDGTVVDIRHIRQSGVRINGGYFILRGDIFDHMRPGEELVEEPFRRLIDLGQLYAHPWDGFWTCIDTFKEKQLLDDRWSRGDTPWALWQANCPALAKR